MWGSVRLLFFVYVARDFSKASALISSEFYWGSWLGYGWMVFSWHFWSFSLFVRVVYLSELVKYSLIERYLAAKIGTISVVLVWWVFFITCDWLIYSTHPPPSERTCVKHGVHRYLCTYICSLPYATVVTWRWVSFSLYSRFSWIISEFGGLLFLFRCGLCILLRILFQDGGFGLLTVYCYLVWTFNSVLLP